MPPFEIVTADVLAWLASYEGEPFHALLCDPPYHLTSISKRFGKPGAAPAKHGKDGAFSRASAGFMGQTWDGGDIAFRPETWAAFLPVLHPGAFGMAFAGSRGWHRLAAAIEDAGYVIHPSIFGWLYGSGFPKATRIDTQIDREALAKTWEHHRYGLQALKPALEPLIVFQKPYEGRPIDDITRTGAGALNVDGARVEGAVQKAAGSPGFGEGRDDGYELGTGREYGVSGRWPANFAIAHAPECFIVGEATVPTGVWGTSNETTNPDRKFSGSPEKAAYRSKRSVGHEDGLETVERWACVPECPVRRLNDQAGMRGSGRLTAEQSRKGGYGPRAGSVYGSANEGGDWSGDASSGYASRFFFTAVEAALTESDVVQYEEKADQEERERGLRGAFRCLMDGKPGIRHDADTLWSENHFVIREDGPEVEVGCRRNPHPTVKPIDLIRWLATLLLPPEAYAPRRLIVPFAGVGSEVIGARQAGWDEIVGVELHERYAAIARQRLAAHLGMF